MSGASLKSNLSSDQWNNPDVDRHPDCCVNIDNRFLITPVLLEGMLLLAVQNLFGNINGAILGLLKGAAHIFSDDADAK